MKALPFLPSNGSLQRAVNIVMVSTLITLLAATAFTIPAGAIKSCTGWSNTGTCCDSPYWPGQQDYQSRQCRDCWTGSCSPWWTEYRCASPSVCP